ncbi:MAG: glycoside hydrolase family 88 protein [candidate division KSB1 bacterium]|nr:glycoside hydrolase family 88 protein [candidate division KSB1 bacterium]MDZ7304816.1 glycoside hydrolase family 88 protein [candidate division KSB1 bacterium]
MTLLSCKSTAQTVVPSHLPWSVRMAESEMNRRGDSFLFNENTKSSWVYETGVFLKGIEQVWRQTGDDKYFAYIKSIVDSYVEPDGSIKTYEVEEYNIDNINCGKLLLTLYNTTHEEKYKNAAFLLMRQLETHPRTKEGGFWHKKIYPWQMWLDGIYMGAPFYAEFAKMFNRPEAFDDVANQIIFIADHTRDPHTGLFYHGWDENRQQKWADPVTGCSPNFWGRAMGWYAMGIVDVLDFLPSDHPKREKILSIFQGLCQALVQYQDHDTGLWYQVLDQGKREGNYLEASASSMFVYAMAKAIRNGYLGNEYLPAVEKGYQGIITHLIKVESNGLVNLTQICRVAGLGGKPYRDGSYEYYISTPIDTNDLKGVGPFIMASVEMERLNGHD